MPILFVKKQQWIILLFYGLAFLTQSFLLLNHDVSWCMHAAERMLAGGTYVQDFFDINPPLSLYLYAPPVLLSHFSSWHFALTLQIYVFTLSAGSLFICSELISSLFSESRLLGQCFLIVLAFIFLIFPLHDFGQREHLLLILIMPYLLATLAYLRGLILPTGLMIAIGLAASMGFGLKPYFLISFFLVEAYLLSQKPNRHTLLRPDLLTLVLALSAYILSLWIFHTNYIYIIVPLAMKYYYAGFHDPWSALCLHPVIFLFGFLSILVLFEKTHRKECMVLFWVTLGLLAAYLLQRTVWTYHFFPPLCTSMLLSVLLLNRIFAQPQGHLSQNVFGIFLAGLLFSFPLGYLGYYLKTDLFYKKTYLPLISFMQDIAGGHSVSILSTRIHNTFPAVDYAHVQFVSRFPHFSMLPGMIRQVRPYVNSPCPPQLKRDQDQFINLVTNDLIDKKPEFIFVDVQRYNAYLETIYFDYLAYLNQNPHFQRVWKHYRYAGYIEKPMPFAIPATQANLYLISPETKIPSLRGIVVALSGTGRHRTAYFLENAQFLKWFDQIITAEVNLTREEEHFLSKKPAGLVQKSKLEKAIVDHLIQQALVAASPRMYAFQVYRRD